MSNLNKIFLMGRLTRDPELRYTPQGVPVCDLGFAVNREYSTKSGERRKDSMFIDVTLWQRQAEVCAQYLNKGSPLFVEGRLEMDTWDGQDGQKRTRYRVVAENFQFIGPSGGPGGGGGGGERRGGATTPAAGGSTVAPAGGGENNYGDNYRNSSAGESANSGSGENYPSGVAEEDVPF